MEDDTEKPQKKYPLSPARMSKTPSWVMLGFVLGAVTVVTMPQLRKEQPAPPPAAAPRTVEPPKSEGPREPPKLTTIEAVFEEWSKYAVWDADTTEVALWNPRTGGFTDYFEVLRYANRYYYRSIPTLTRRIIARGKPIPECPLQFTETEEQYLEWKQHGRSERPVGDYRPVSAFPSGPAPTVEKAKPERPTIAPPKFEVIAPFEPPPVKSADGTGAKK